MSDPTPPHFTTLSQDATHLLHLVQEPYATTLQYFTDRGLCDQVALKPEEVQAFLRALPRAVVLTALAIHEDCPVCFVCQVCTGCACPEAGLDALGDDGPPLIPVPGASRAAPGTVCACVRYAGVHLADGCCLAWRDPAARHGGRHNRADGVRCLPACFGQPAWRLLADAEDVKAGREDTP